MNVQLSTLPGVAFIPTSEDHFFIVFGIVYISFSHFSHFPEREISTIELPISSLPGLAFIPTA